MKEPKLCLKASGNNSAVKPVRRALSTFIIKLSRQESVSSEFAGRP
jgi:hypothetical protein